MRQRFRRLGAAIAMALVAATITPTTSNAGPPMYWSWQVQLAGDTTTSPTLCGGDGVVWRGAGSDDRVYFSKGGHTVVLPDFVRTNDAPAASDCRFESPRISYRSSADNYIYYLRPSGSGWDGPHRVAGPAGSGPSMLQQITLPDQDLIVWRGYGSDNGIYQTYVESFTGELRWSSEKLPPGARTDDRPAVTVVQAGFVVVWRAVGERNLHFSVNHHGQWSIPAIAGTGGQTTSAPAASNNGYVVWRGPDNDKRLFWSRVTDDLRWETQRVICSVGGASSSPTASYGNGGDNLLRVGWKGVGNDQRIWQSSGALTDSVGPGCVA